MGLTEDASSRNGFSENYLTWIAVRHFLSPRLLRELLEVTITKTTGGRLSLSDLFVEVLTEGEPAFAAWAIRPRDTSDRVGDYLQQVIRAVVWHGDAEYAVPDDGPVWELASIRELSEAIAVSRLDLASLSPVFQFEGAVQPLHGILKCLTLAKASLADQLTDPVISMVRECFADIPLRSVVLKHLGDLLVDTERWQAAEALYQASYTEADVLTEEWSGLAVTLVPAVSQSMAAIRRALDGPSEAAKTLSELDGLAVRNLDWVSLANLPNDLLDASYAARNFDALQDRRIGVLMSPNLIWSHNLSYALENWLDRRYEDAYRWFWSVLRRQIALGAATQTRLTKGLFGRCLIDGSSATFDSQRQTRHLGLGVRLLVECGNAKTADRTEWSERIVANGIDDVMLQSAIDATLTAPGYQAQRTGVLLVLLAKWCEKLSPDRQGLARLMIELASKYASEDVAFPQKGIYIRAEAFKALSAIAAAKPEFRSQSGPTVMTACLKGVRDGSPIVVRDALDAAYEYADALDADELVQFTSAVLDMIEAAALNSSDLIASRSALSYLQSVYGKLGAQMHREIRGRVADALLLLSSSGSSQGAFLSLLQNLEPEDARRLSNPARLSEVVESLRSTATAVNRSDASEAMSALLEAPDIAGHEAVTSALGALETTLSATLAGRAPVSFMDAYRTLMSLVRRKTAIEKFIDHEEGSSGSPYQRIFERLLALWQKAESDTSMFMAFAIPLPEVPDRTIVHNWAFGSLAFSRSLGLEREMRAALERAARNPLLRDAILVASTVASPSDVLDFEPSLPFPDTTGESFYAGLGRRLVAVSALSREARSGYVAVLLKQCYRFGPRGEDAAILAMAMNLNIQSSWEPSVRDYGRRLENDRFLRLALGPLFAKVSERTEADGE